VFEDDHWGAFAADRWRLTDDLTVELGLRHDDHSGVDDAVTSPRLHLAWAGPVDNLWRLGWGRYAQSQRPYELAVEDAERAPAPIERSEHRVLGWERLFERPARRGPTALRIELYRRTVENPRPRYENLLEPFDAFPEGELDRHRFAPTEARAEGVELFLRGRLGARLDGWLDYAWAKSEDRIDGRWQPRLIDQRHTLNFNLRWRLGESWTLDLAGLLHSGRPTTAVGLESTLEEPAPDDGEGDDEGDGDDEVELVPVLGPINGARLADYARLDLRLARGFALARGRLTFHLDVQNLLDRENAAGFSVELDDEEGELVFDPERWPGLVASAGVVWEF
jgi:outer membrane receptor protein involved in Fe transport